MNTKQKKLVSAEIKFSGFISPTDFINVPYYNYSLKINYVPLSHTDLTIAFALPWYVYFSMYLFVGVLSVFMACLFLVYHKLVSRKNRSKAIEFVWYIRLYLPAPIRAMVYAVFPIAVYTLMIAVFFTQHLMTFKLNSLWCQPDDSVCLNKKFLISLTARSDLTPAQLVTTQNRILGYLLIHCGIWIIWRVAHLTTLKPTPDEAVGNMVGFDSNVWFATSWKRLNFFAMNTLVIIMELFFIHISFSNIFSDNLWYFIAGFKVVGLIVENSSEILLSNNMMLGPISTTIDLMENLVTFGAPDFLVFISSFVLGLGVQMSERAFIEPTVDIVVDYIKANLYRVLNFFSKIMGDEKAEDNEEEEYEIDKVDIDAIDEPVSPVAASPANEAGGASPNSFAVSPVPIKSQKSKEDMPSQDDSQGSDILLTENSAENEIADIFHRLNAFNDRDDDSDDNDKFNIEDIVRNKHL